jgi:cytochrome c peroxidase
MLKPTLFQLALLGPILLSGTVYEASGAPQPEITITALDGMQHVPGGLAALPTPQIPPDNPMFPEKIELGKLLFFDTRLSRDRSTSCATCHDPEKAYSDGRTRGIGIENQQLPRRTPSILNAAYNAYQFWDGRAETLEEQAKGPILAAAEMGMPDEKTLIDRLEDVPEYRRRFDAVFGSGITLRNITLAIAAFERTLVTPNSPLDAYLRGDKNALSDQEKRGFILFFGKAGCTQCHNGPNLTDSKFYSLGAVPGREEADPGRFSVTKDQADRAAFKTPSLRNIALRSPYMHDGSMATLDQVIDWYDQGGGTGRKSELLFKLNLSSDEKKDLLAFLHALSAPIPNIGKPAIPN